MFTGFTTGFRPEVNSVSELMNSVTEPRGGTT
jgi:hypothetical protein